MRRSFKRGKILLLKMSIRQWVPQFSRPSIKRTSRRMMTFAVIHFSITQTKTIRFIKKVLLRKGYTQTIISMQIAKKICLSSVAIDFGGRYFIGKGSINGFLIIHILCFFPISFQQLFPFFPNNTSIQIVLLVFYWPA